MQEKSQLGCVNFKPSTQTKTSPLDHELVSYRLAYTDRDFLKRDDLRGVRFQLELQKPEMVMQENGVHTTIVIFGSARLRDPETAQAALTVAKQSKDAERIATAERNLINSQYYQKARDLARLIASHSQSCPAENRLHVVTGGGPGIMEAANRGAADFGGKSIGLNIVLPDEQLPNPYISPEFCFRFHYFGIRKMHFMMRAGALVVFPGGFGTLDELFDALTLIQTGKSTRVPVVLLGRKFWQRVIDFPFLVEQGVVAAKDLELISWVDTAEEAWQCIRDFYELANPASSATP